jgi:hypothetical protein
MSLTDVRSASNMKHGEAHPAALITWFPPSTVSTVVSLGCRSRCC